MGARGTAARAGPRIVAASGARATEERVLADVAALLPGSAGDVAALARPVVVVVPSRSLRLHLAARLVAARGRPVAGVEIVTLRALASRLAARADGAPRRSGARLLPVLVGRFAALEPSLRELATVVEDGVSSLVATVRDLLDAGLTPPGADALVEMVASASGGDERERASALVRTAAAVARVMEAGALDLAADVLRRAVSVLKADPDAALPARAVLIHGFADATAVATDLIEALLATRDARLYLDRPPDPADPSREDLGAAFSARFLQRLERVAEPEAAATPIPSGRLEMFRAPGAHAEVREVARRIRALLDRGSAPESIAVVARDLGPYALAIQTHFPRLALPLSALDAAGSIDPAGRRVRALCDVLRRGGRTPTDAWLSASGPAAGFDLRLALHACGAARIRDAAALDAEALLDGNGEFMLPIRRGLAEVAGEGEGDAPARVAPHRRLAGGRLKRAVGRAATLARLLESWPADAGPGRHLRLVRRLLSEGLGWTPEVAGAETVAAALATLAAELPEELPLSRDEFFSVLRRELEERAAGAMGGAGGGVQVLSVTEARARTFGHLFLLGLNRDSFPRQVREDPLLPDRLRQAIERDVLPQVPVKRTGFDEERYLFAQLLSSAERVTVSWQVCDDDGKACSLSPLVARLCLAAGGEEPPLVGAVLAPVAGELRPPGEHAIVVGLHGSRRDFGRALEVAVGASAPARLAALEELDPDRATREGRRRAASLGPYLGLVGAPREGADPRRGDPAVTVAEGVAACPWQAFLTRIVRLEPSPDPLAAVPGVDARALGMAVHRALGALLAPAEELPGTLTDAVAASPRAAPRPSASALAAALREGSAQVAREVGLALPGLERVLEERARPFLEVAVATLWPAGSGPLPVLGLETNGELALEDAGGASHELAFRADLVEAAEAGIRLTDFKTGRPLSNAKKDATRRAHILAAVARGEALQAGAYALAAAGRRCEARYLYLRPDLEEHERVLAVAGDDPDLRPALATAASAILGAWAHGAFFPRLELPDRPVEPRRCRFCEVRDACVRGDSGARRRLAMWAAGQRERRGALAGAEAAVLELWNLPVRTGDEGEEDEA